MRDKGNHRLRRMLIGSKTLSRITQQTPLDGETKPIAAAALGSGERQILGTQHVVLGHLGGIGWDAEQTSTLFWRQKGAAGHRNLRVMAEGRS